MDTAEDPGLRRLLDEAAERAEATIAKLRLFTGLVVGAHAGALFAGMIGDGERVEPTVIGDTVNVVARLQELTKETGIPLLASDSIVRAAGEGDDPRWRAIPGQALPCRDAVIDLRAWTPA